MSRRYRMHDDKIGKYSVYHEWFDRLKLQSPVLNPHGGANIHSLNFNDREGIKSCLLQWKGQEGQGGRWFYPDGNEWRFSHLKSATEDIKELQEEFGVLKQMRVNEGKRAPKDMPKEMCDRLLMAEAALDICQEEIEFLEKKLLTFTDRDKKESEYALLKRGPEGAGKLRNGVLIRVDGQTVKPDSKGVLRICDERSPYHGMMTADYFELIVRPWKGATIKAKGKYWIASKLASKRGEPCPPCPKIPWPKKPEASV